jgi:heme-degrading monooxygenase HmoA
MVTIGMNYSVRAGKEKIFEDACASVIQTMRGIDGHADSHLYREVGADSRQYLIVSVWSSEQAFRDFVASDTFKKVTNWGAQNILEGRPSHTVYH